MKQLPEKFALDKAVNGQRRYQGTIEIQHMKRLTEMLADTSGEVDFSIQFERAARLLGKARVKVKTELALMCTISNKKFMFPVEIDSMIGFIDDLTYEDLLDVDMEASWVEEGMINPLEIIEDELILAVPDAPFNESHEDDEFDEAILTEEKPNPFSVLKNLK
ncbi:MAG: DUF177 domain-containing protein [Marinicellaceae bacterium]